MHDTSLTDRYHWPENVRKREELARVGICGHPVWQELVCQLPAGHRIGGHTFDPQAPFHG